MTIKLKTSIYISLLFTALFGVAAAIIIVVYADFRKEEFKERLKEKAKTTIKLLIEVQSVDYQTLKVIDRNTINHLYNEKTLVFDDKYNLIYSSLDDTRINWTRADLDYLKKYKTFFKKDGEYEVYGVYYDSNYKDFFALISANDNYGKRKIEFLNYLMLITYTIVSLLGWILTFYVIKKQISPLDYLYKKISKINGSNLETRLIINENSQNEIDLLGKEFNFMMGRIEYAYQRQKEFTAHASHELRTPLARVLAQLNNYKSKTDEKTNHFIDNITDNISQINDLIHSLLILSKIDIIKKEENQKVRVDEAIFESIEKIYWQFKDIKVNLDVEDSPNLNTLLEVSCNQNLLEIAFNNLLRNAYLYSDNQQVNIRIFEDNQRLVVCISNTGVLLTQQEQQKIFQPFVRGTNAQGKSGSGLGLRIVQRILNVYNFSIRYSDAGAVNQFLIAF